MVRSSNSGPVESWRRPRCLRAWMTLAGAEEEDVVEEPVAEAAEEAVGVEKDDECILVGRCLVVHLLFTSRAI